MIELPPGWQREKPTEPGLYTIQHASGAIDRVAVDFKFMGTLRTPRPLCVFREDYWRDVESMGDDWLWYRHESPTPLPVELLKKIAEETK